MSSFGKDQYMITLEPHNHQGFYVQLEDNGTLAATAPAGLESEQCPSVYFYVETAGDSQYQLKPFNQSDTYIAVINGEIALKTESECMESERSFYVERENGDFTSFHVYTAETTYYLYCEYNGVLGVATTKPGRATWFHEQPKDKETILVENKEMLYATNSFIDIITEIAFTEE